MAKKNFTSGLDSLFSSTTPISKATPNNDPDSTKSELKYNLPASAGDVAKILIHLPADIKMKLDIYCVRNRTTKQNFIANLIINSLEDKK
jgi:hypothetical protein